MKCTKLLCLVVLVCYTSCWGSEIEEELKDHEDKWPTIGITILVRNMAHSLPFVLTYLQLLDYPKDRLYVWFYNDGSSDESLSIIETWTETYKTQYRSIYLNGDKGGRRSGDDDSSEWTEERLKHVIQLREKALHFARKRWVDFIFMMDADVVLTEKSTLKRLVRRRLPLVAPMLLSDGLYSNFWAAMTAEYYYERCDQYEEISKREALGCFQVPMIHSAVLMDLRTSVSDRLTYDPSQIEGYSGPTDDIIAFAVSAANNGVSMTVCNEHLYGFIPVPVDMNHGVRQTTEAEQFLNVKMEALAHGVIMPIDPELSKFVTYPPKDRLGVDRVFWINLERREERRRLMEASFRELGVDARRVKAVDGRNLDLNDLSDYGVTLMPNYEDPYHKRPMKAGEVGCFLSHYTIWKEIAARHVPVSLVLEDDVKFAPFFRRRFGELLRELDRLPDWDLVYIGRKILESEREEVVSRMLVRPRYSYWTLGYVVSERGARKLLRAEPAGKLLPVDELLPIMYDHHPNETWKSYFPRRDLVALSAAPLLAFPTHYTGEPGYVSDTEASAVLPAPAPPAADHGEQVIHPTYTSTFPTHYTGEPGYVSDTEASAVLPAPAPPAADHGEQIARSRYEL